MSKVSVIIPSCNEQFLVPTVKDLLKNARGDVEIIVVLDGYWPDPRPPDDSRLITLHRGKKCGMRPGINAAAAIASGEYLMKCDAHCMFDEGWDEKLKADCEPNWVVVPRRYALDAESWTRKRGRHPIDYMFLSYPNHDGKGTDKSAANVGDRGGNGLHGRPWEEKNRDKGLLKKPIDDLMSAQGSCWFMPRDYFDELELMDEENYGTFGSEFQEIGLKAWLGGGRVVRNKKTWYAHLHKGRKYGRGYHLGRHDADKATKFANRWVTDEAWGKQVMPFRWFIHKFWPVPGWPEEWGP